MSIFYQAIINNIKNYLKKVDPYSNDTLNAFQISEVLSIALCKSKEKIIADIIKD